MAIRENLVGQRFGELVVLEYDHTHKTPSGQSKAFWKCQCDCGNTTVVSAQSLKCLHTTSCGCNSSKNHIGETQRTHGESKTRLYAIWCGMISRCNNPNRIAYKNYGGRGISVCEEWNRYLPFRQWALDNGYTNELTLERKDVDGNYCPVLVAHYGDLVKYVCKTFFGWNGEKDEYGRTLLQKVGTDAIRAKRPDYWVSFVADIMSFFPGEWDYVLIPDCRFPNEVDYIRNTGFSTVHLRVVRDGFVSPLTPEQQAHPSELELFPFLDTNHIIIAHNKQMVRGDVLIDDGPHNLVNGQYFRILFDAPHNRGFNEKKYGMYRAVGWEQVYQLIHDNLVFKPDDNVWRNIPV